MTTTQPLSQIDYGALSEVAKQELADTLADMGTYYAQGGKDYQGVSTMHKTAERLINKSKSGKPLTRLENKYLDCYIAHCSLSRET
ncbi:hypothetical protein BI375_05870 [Vibrio rotiferianus]|uniref:Uncharacterized protein n=1 Tax=Vibrio rotiferianus TaxID=190895 RepID=A0ABX3D879_9VIBR|nr:hypothetical protein [Vibrio rotiferianus]OHY92985.1 hypothetical protein BI375_05870 [Vibrio rotiferianus]